MKSSKNGGRRGKGPEPEPEPIPATETDGAIPPSITRFQRFEIVTVRRSQLLNAPYNPRLISEGSRKRLKKAIQQHGLVEPPVWNRRTGNIVGGHQRLDVLDQLERNGDYELQAAAIDVDDAEEKKLNVQLNNARLMGEWDVEKLAALNTDFGLAFDDMGFTESDVDFLFSGDERFSKAFPEAEEEVAEAKDKIRDIKKARDEGTEKMKSEGDAGFYLIVVCEDVEEKQEFMRRIGMPVYEQYVDADRILRRMHGAVL